MKSKTLNVFLTLTIFFVTSLLTQSFSQESEQLFQQGLMAENGEGNLQDAISIYEKVIADESAENSVKAKAQLHIGLCYEKLGKTEAIKAYELVLQNYQNYEAEVQLASLRLADLIKVDNEDMSVINLYEKGSGLHNSSLSPDGTKLAGMDYTIGQNIAVYDRLTGQTQIITNYDYYTPGHGWTYFPAWSPDGKEIVYMFSDWKGSNSELQVTTLKGETRTLIKNESNAGHIIPRQWSKDGSSILTFKQDSTNSYTIGLVPAKGGSFKVLYKPQWKSKFVSGDASVASLSPDGKFVVFVDGPEEKLDVFIINAEGGTPTVLSDHPANEYTVAWSPDGKYIAFIRETKGGSLLYAVEMAEGKPAGPPFLIKEGMQNVDLNNWTEQGICYNLWLDLHDIYTLPLNPETGTPTGDPKPLNYTPTGSNISPAWSHDGKYLAFVSYADIPKVVILPAAGGETRNYIIPAPGLWAPSVFDLCWLPDNSGVGFSSSTQKPTTVVYLLDIVTGKWQNWLPPVLGWTRIGWGPDVNSFIYAKWNDNDSNVNVPDHGLHQFNIKTGETKYIFKPEADTLYSIGRLKFSRDYKKLFFSIKEVKNRTMMVLDLESGESKVLSEKLWSPTFSPDGKKILTFGKKYSVAILSLDGKILHEYNIAQHFTPGTRIGSPDWSPDGKQLVFTTRNMKYETYLMKNLLK